MKRLLITLLLGVLVGIATQGCATGDYATRRGGTSPYGQGSPYGSGGHSGGCH